MQGQVAVLRSVRDKPWQAHVDVQGTHRWKALTEVTLPDGQIASLVADAQPEGGSWTYGLWETSIPLGTQLLALQNGPIHWTPARRQHRRTNVLLAETWGQCP